VYGKNKNHSLILPDKKFATEPNKFEKMLLQNKIFRFIFFGTALIILAGNIYSLFFYAKLIPMHVDEGNFFFHFTNKSFQNRFELYYNHPIHSLTIYLSKASIWLLGKNGIGWRLPVIVFSVLSGCILFYFVWKTVKSFRVAILAVSFLFLNPFFMHYSHELRGYPPLFFFAVCSYAFLWLLLEKKPVWTLVWNFPFSFGLLCGKYFSLNVLFGISARGMGSQTTYSLFLLPRTFKTIQKNQNQTFIRVFHSFFVGGSFYCF
jgi:4-amino-4-deoxy-L-arabinose transferase-like glycosyltransferase